jgi:hypothetical protein
MEWAITIGVSEARAELYKLTLMHRVKYFFY